MNSYTFKKIFDSYFDFFKDFEYYFYKKKSCTAKSLFKLCKNNHGIKEIACHNIILLTNYYEYMNSIIDNIKSASSTIEMMFYIWKSDGIVNDVIEALIEAANRGIKCRIMLDSVGSWSFFYTTLCKKMRKAGIELVKSFKLNFFYFFFKRIDIRQHKKMIIIDNSIVYVGSMNMIDPRFFKQNKNCGQWIDIVVKMEGPISIIFSIIYSYDWKLETNKHILINYKIDIPINYKLIKPVQFIVSGNGFSKKFIKYSIITAIFSAKKQLIFTTPYFVPSKDLVDAICIASLRGVKVFIILPYKNNSFLVQWASRTFYSKLLESGVKIYQFNDGLLHTKSISIDGKLSIIGSANLDIRSLELNSEIIIAIDDKIFSEELVLLQYDYVSKSIPIFLDTWNRRPLWNRIIERFCYIFSPLL